MIACQLSHLEARCRERGYTLAEVRACVVSEDGDQITVDETHQAYPSAHGPGTELKKLLSGWPFRLVAGADCKCTQRAAHMDAQGCDWVESNLKECVGYLRESAAERGLPFLDAAGSVLVRRAIHNARKAEAARAKEAQQKGPPAV